MVQIRQLVILNDVDSDTQVIQHGASQESALGPLLFLVYIDNLHYSILYGLPYLWMTQIYLS